MEVALKQIYQAYLTCHQGKAKSAQAQQYGVKALQKMMRKFWKGDFNRLTAPAKHSTGAVKTALPKATKTTSIWKGDFNRLTAPAKHSTGAVKTALPKAPTTTNTRKGDFNRLTTPANKGLPIGNLTSFILSKQNSSKINSLFASYIGHFQHAKHHKLVAEKITQFPCLKYFFYHNQSKHLSIMHNKFATKFSHQWQFFNHNFAGFVVLMQKDKQFISNISNAAIHIKQLTAYLQQLQSNSQNYVFISEQGYVHNRLKQRKVRQLFISNYHRSSI